MWADPKNPRSPRSYLNLPVLCTVPCTTYPRAHEVSQPWQPGSLAALDNPTNPIEANPRPSGMLHLHAGRQVSPVQLEAFKRLNVERRTVREIFFRRCTRGCQRYYSMLLARTRDLIVYGNYVLPRNCAITSQN